MSSAFSKKVQISNRDMALFDYLFVNKIATANQISLDVFGGGDLHVVRRRLRSLTNSRYLQVDSVQHEKKLKLVYFLTKSTFERFLSERLGRSWKQIKSDSRIHDLTLVDLRRVFSCCKDVKSYTAENSIEADFKCPPGIPTQSVLEMHSDGIIELKRENKIFHLAIEYESAHKKKARYERHLSGYYLRNEIHGVVYVVGDSSLAELLADVDKRLTKDRRSKVFIATLDSVLKKSSPLQFTSSQGDILKIA